jgi:MFS superfamily sulfate permease-like transporter
MTGGGLETTRRQRCLTDASSLGADLIAGLTNALVYIPQGIAYALVAGVSPVHGLYTGIIAPLVGALTAGSSFEGVSELLISCQTDRPNS